MTEYDDPAQDARPGTDVPASDASGGSFPPSQSVNAPTAEKNTATPGEPLSSVELTGLPGALQNACGRAGWTRLTPVQARAIPYMLQGRDIMVQSRTGSGKTGTYLLPLLARLDPRKQAVQALILVPTRELAVQVEREADMLFHGSGIGITAVYGGVGYGRQIEALRKGVGVVVGTPGRILDHLFRHTLNLDQLSCLVFDEADRMLSIGFYPDIKEIQRHLPRKDIHATLFSATYPPHVLRLAEEFLREPELLSLSATQVHVAEVQHLYCECKRMDKDRALLRILEVENPASAIIFCNTKSDVHFITAVLQGFGFNADELSADLSQGQRERVLDNLRKGKIRFLVATDVAARGIDIPDLSHVILYTPPEEREAYIHRAGRTGRAGAAGVVISLVDIMEKMELQRIAQFYKISMIRHPVPTEEEAAQAAGLRVAAILETRNRQLTGLERERLGRFTPLVRSLAEDPEQIGLLSLLIDDCYQGNMNPAGFLPAGTGDQRTPKKADTRAENSRCGRRRSAFPTKTPETGGGTQNEMEATGSPLSQQNMKDAVSRRKKRHRRRTPAKSTLSRP